MWAPATRAMGGLCAATMALLCAAAAAAQTGRLIVVNDWGNGFQAEVRITNPGGTLVDWRAEFDLPGAITSIWDARIVSHSGTHYVIRGASWNPNVPAGGVLTFGFVAAPGSPALSVAIAVHGAGAPTPTRTRASTRTATAATAAQPFPQPPTFPSGGSAARRNAGAGSRSERPARRFRCSCRSGDGGVRNGRSAEREWPRYGLPTTGGHTAAGWHGAC